MAPEIFECDNYQSKVDVWSLGILLYEMIHKKSPFSEKSVFKIYKNILNQEFWFKKGIDPKAKDLILSILQIDPHKRPSAIQIKKHAYFKNLKKNLKKSFLQLIWEKDQNIFLSSYNNVRKVKGEKPIMNFKKKQKNKNKLFKVKRNVKKPKYRRQNNQYHNLLSPKKKVNNIKKTFKKRLKIKRDKVSKILMMSQEIKTIKKKKKIRFIQKMGKSMTQLQNKIKKKTRKRKIFLRNKSPKKLRLFKKKRKLRFMNIKPCNNHSDGLGCKLSKTYDSNPIYTPEDYFIPNRKDFTFRNESNIYTRKKRSSSQQSRLNYKCLKIRSPIEVSI